MITLFNSEIKAKEIRKILMGHLSELTDKYIKRCSMLDASGTVSGAAHLFSKIIPELIQELPLAVYLKDNVKTHSKSRYITYARLFNGMYYEKVSLSFVQDVIYQDWLFDYCKLNPKYYLKLREVFNIDSSKALLTKILEPKLTVMCLKNGVVDFKDVGVKRTDEILKPFSPSYHCIKQYDFKWNPDAECPLWRTFLGVPAYVNQPIADVEGVLPEKEKRAVLHKFLGSCFVDRSRVKFEYMLILYGGGANGKSVIKEVLDGVFGKEEVFPNLSLRDMAKDDDHGMLTRKAIEGYRFSYCTEMSPKALSDPNMAKILFSGEGMSGRAIGENVSVITDIPLFVCNSNYDWTNFELPKSSDKDESLTRRVLLLSFDKKIPEDRRDPELVSKLLREKEGIFMWLVRGYKRLMRDKWKINNCLSGRIDIVRAEANNVVVRNGKVIHGSIDAYVNYKGLSPVLSDEHSNDLNISTTDIYANYEEFCDRNGIVKVSMRKLSIDLETLGFSKKIAFGAKRRNGFTVYWNKPHNEMIFGKEVPSLTKIFNVDILLGEDGEHEDEFIND